MCVNLCIPLFQITQYSCDYQNLAPEGCTQYYFGTNTNVVNSFNFYGGTHLADQNQNICVRSNYSLSQN